MAERETTAFSFKDGSKEEIIDLISSVLDVDKQEILNNPELGDTLEWDSIGHMDIVIGIEEALRINFSAEELKEFLMATDVEKLSNLVQEMIH